MKRVLVLLVSLLGCVAAAAQEVDETFRKAMNNAGHELVECAAYSIIMAAALAKTGKDDAVSDHYQKTSNVLLQRAGVIALEIGQKIETIEARLQMSMGDMRRQIDNNATNISILLNKYALHCKNVTENGQARLGYWVDKATAEELSAKKQGR